jgi:hypothetical protein
VYQFWDVLTSKAFAKIISLLFYKEKVFCKTENSTVEEIQQKREKRVPK